LAKRKTPGTPADGRRKFVSLRSQNEFIIKIILQVVYLKNKRQIKLILKNRNIRICLLGNFISTIGDCFNDLAILSFVFIIYQSVEKLSWIYTVIYIAMFLASPFLGVISDKFQKKSILVFSSIIQSIVVLIIIIFPDFRIILTCMFFESMLAVLVRLTIRSTIKETVSSESLLLTNSLSTSINQVTRVISPAAAGFLMAFWRDDIIFATRVVLGIDVVTFLLSTVLFLFLLPEKKYDKRVKSSFIKDIKTGWKALFENRTIKIYYIYAILLSIAGTIPFLLKVPLVMDILQGDAKTLGIVNSFSAVGAIIGAILANIILKDVRKKYFLLFRMLQGLAFLFIGIICQLWIVIILFFFSNLFQNISKVSEESFLQHSIEKDVIGRVSSWYISANALIVLIMLRIGVVLSNIISIDALYFGVGIWYFLIFVAFLIIYLKKNNS